jgi:hypothetical protein
MVELKIWTVILMIGMGMAAALILIFFGFLLGRKTQGEDPLAGLSMFKPDEKPPEEDIFEKALRGPEEGGYSDEELDEMKRARPYEGL